MKKTFLLLMAFSAISTFLSCSSDDDNNESVSENYDVHRGIVKENQEVDMGLKIEVNGISYKVIFAKSNLTATGLAAKESDFGDYFAWAATEPWLTSYDCISSIYTPTTWKSGKEKGYVPANAPYYEGSSYTKYTSNGINLESTDDAATKILGGDWQLPPKEVWVALYNTTQYSWTWTTQDGCYGYRVTSLSDDTKSLFLPAAGCIEGTSFDGPNSGGLYWIGTTYSSERAYRLYLRNNEISPQITNSRFFGLSVRPVRLVAD